MKKLFTENICNYIITTLRLSRGSNVYAPIRKVVKIHFVTCIETLNAPYWAVVFGTIGAIYFEMVKWSLTWTLKEP